MSQMGYQVQDLFSEELWSGYKVPTLNCLNYNVIKYDIIPIKNKKENEILIF